MSKNEIRSISTTELTIETRDDGKPKITGYAAVFDSDSVDFGYFREVIRRGAFAKSLKDSGDVRALLDHDTGKIIARTTAGSLTLNEDNKGLRVEITPIETDDGKKAVEWVRSGVVDGMSFGFRTMADRWSIKDGANYRELLEVDLFEVSLVAFPAYPATTVQMRSAESVWKEHQERVSKRLSSFQKRLRIISI